MPSPTTSEGGIMPVSLAVSTDYRRYRARGVAAHIALAWARSQARGLTFEWDGEPGPRGTLSRDGFDIVASVVYDDYPDLSYLGDFTDDWSPDVIRAHESEYVPRFEYRYFEPSYPAREIRRDLSSMGYPRHVADCTARANVRDALRLRRETESYVVWVRAYREDVELGASCMGGVDIDPSTPWNEQTAYVDEVASDLVDEVVTEARATLARLCQSEA